MANTSATDTTAHNLYGGIQTIPLEILQAVFEAGHSPFGDFENTVSQICQQWRQVALGTPVLWTNISLIVASPRSRAKAHVYLQRSSTLSLTLHCDFTSYPDDDSPEAVEGIDNLLATDIWNDLTQQSHRWFTFKFTSLTDADTIAIFHMLHPLDVPVLDTFDLVVHQDQASHGEEEFVFQKDIPSLRCLRLAGFSLIRCSLPSMEDLTHLDICVNQERQVAVGSFLKILLGLPNLQHLSLHNALYGWPSSEHPAAELLQLRTLQLSDSGWALCRYLFLFGAPNLHEVTIHNVHKEDFPPHLLYKNHNFPSVQHLSLVGSPDKGIPFRKLSKFFPTVARLSIIEHSENKKPNVVGLLAKVHASHSHPALAWRDLRHLFFYPQPDSAEVVRDLVLGCRASGMYIQSVSLPLGDDGERRFAGLRDIAEVNEVTNDPHAPYHVNSLGGA